MRSLHVAQSSAQQSVHADFKLEHPQHVTSEIRFYMIAQKTSHYRII